ncbi:hypothetical protein [Amycolatopsis sp. NPDC059657]|uniref:hypothetical protein n=1 Tax=Amycolatopsis sp. NPDC059657 TaxID=3346899 RepID=UPI003670E907
MKRTMRRSTKAVLVAAVSFLTAAVVPGSASAGQPPCDWKRNDCNFIRVSNHYNLPDVIIATFHAYDWAYDEIPGTKKEARIGAGGKTTYFFPKGAAHATLRLTSGLSGERLPTHIYDDVKDYCFRVTNTGVVHGPLPECHY